jgi:hypothetical protein
VKAQETLQEQQCLKIDNVAEILAYIGTCIQLLSASLKTSSTLCELRTIKSDQSDRNCAAQYDVAREYSHKLYDKLLSS